MVVGGAVALNELRVDRSERELAEVILVAVAVLNVVEVLSCHVRRRVHADVVEITRIVTGPSLCKGILLARHRDVHAFGRRGSGVEGLGAETIRLLLVVGRSPVGVSVRRRGGIEIFSVFLMIRWHNLLR